MSKLIGTIRDNITDIKTIIKSGGRGPQGLSAYEVWLQEGNKGTVEDYLADLKGEKGDPGEVSQEELAEVKNDLAQHKLDYASQRQQDQLKVAKVEKDINDYKQVMSQVNVNHEAKQSASGYGTISLPPNTANGQVSVSVKGLTATNTIVDGRFQDTNRNILTWNSGDIINVENDILTITVAGTQNRVMQRSNLKFNEGDKLYVKFDYKLSEDVTFFSFSLRNDYYLTADHIIYKPLSSYKLNQWDTISTVSTTSVTDNGYWNIYTKNDTGSTLQLKHTIMINLTQTFGVGNEPTVEQCDKIFANYFEGTKSTVSAFRLRSVDSINLIKNGNGENGTEYWLPFSFYSPDPTITFDGEWFVIEDSTLMGQGYYQIVTVEPDTDYTLSFETVDGVIDIRDAQTDQIIASSDMPFTFNVGNSRQIKVMLYNYSYDQTSKFKQIMLQKGTKQSAYESYHEYTQYITAKDESNKIVNLMSHEGVHDEIDLDKRELIKRIGVDEEGLTYQLAEPEIIPVEVSGNIVAHPNGTIYIEPVVADANVYNDGIIIFEQELNIDYIDKIAKVDYVTGVETPLDVSKAVISGDKKSFTHPDLMNGDMVFFEYFYSNESTQGEATVEYYDSRYVIKDKSLDKFYQWQIVVDNGVPDVELVEV